MKPAPCLLFALLLSSCTTPPLQPSVLHLNPEAAFIYDTLLESEPFCADLIQAQRLDQ